MRRFLPLRKNIASKRLGLLRKTARRDRRAGFAQPGLRTEDT
jgi:hypothetical protein